MKIVLLCISKFNAESSFVVVHDDPCKGEQFTIAGCEFVKAGQILINQLQGKQR